MHVILMGPQGSGKGTQADLVAPRFNLVHLSTGDLFRSAMAANTELGQRVKRYYDRGDLVPDDVTISIVEARLNDLAATSVRGALFDGFPRTAAQAEALDQLLVQRNECVAAVIQIEVPLEMLVTRLAGRRVCVDCGATYHIEFNPSTRPGICDRCGGKVVQRDDDTPAAIKQRLALYAEQTTPLLAYYRQRGLVVSVNGDQPIDRVTVAIASVLNRVSGSDGAE